MEERLTKLRIMVMDAMDRNPHMALPFEIHEASEFQLNQAILQYSLYELKHASSKYSVGPHVGNPTNNNPKNENNFTDNEKSTIKLPDYENYVTPSKNILSGLIHGLMNGISEDILWYKYNDETSTECQICHIPIIKGDHCRPITCNHKFHAECIVRYADRIDSHCPICAVPIDNIL